jgi:hypothetical protein
LANNDDLLRDLNIASQDIKKSIGGKAAEGIEKRYGIAYQKCVKAGIKPPLRKKYRRGT